MPDGMEESDAAVLDQMLGISGEFLVIIVRRKDLFRREFAHFFPGPIDEVLSRLNSARKQISQGDVDWKYLEGVGLTGDTLRWKRDQLLSETRTGFVGRILKRINSFMNSLSKAIPGLDLVLEYKENVEA